MAQHTATSDDALARAFIPAPEDSADWPAWRERIFAAARRPRPDQTGEDSTRLYDREAQSWASRCYSQGFLMLWDAELIDHQTGTWQVERLLDRAKRDFGGYDLVVLWCNYPLSGVDPRHQLRYYDELPGGRAGLKEAIDRFHARGVRVLVDHKPWVPGVPDNHASVEDAFVDLVKECGFDGIYLDCSNGPSDAFREALAGHAGPDRIFQSEAPARIDPAVCEVSSWQQMTDDSAAPGTYRLRLLDRQHLVCESRRYFHDPIKELQRAWMNGGGFVIWENVFGYWASYSERCKSWMRLLFPAQRRFADWFIHGDWRPHAVGGTRKGVYVSEWSHHGQTLWTVVNRVGHTLEKHLLTLPDQPGAQFVDIISGQELTVLDRIDGQVRLAGWLERDGLMGVLAVEEVDSDLHAFLAMQRARFETANWTAEPWVGEHRKTDRIHVLRPVQPTEAVSAIPENMVRIPDRDGWMVTRYRMRECGYIAGAVDEKHVYDAFEKSCPYSCVVNVHDIAIDAFPVTNADFAKFLAATHYTPSEPSNFLKHWTNGRPPAGEENHPVVYVSLDDARAYAQWAGKRLPREEEWQAAAQGKAQRLWPWGDTFDPSRCNHATNGTTPVDAYPSGRTPEGVWDLSGNVWEMTESERSDGHTRYQILKGGCWYEVKNSHWLFDTGARPADWGAKHILCTDGWNRCATIGFRCVVDLSRHSVD